MMEIEFEHAVRRLVRAAGEVKRKPLERSRQLELGRALQCAHLQYKHVGRVHGAEYGKTIRTLRNVACATTRLVSSFGRESDVARFIRFELKGIRKTSEQIDNGGKQKPGTARLEQEMGSF